MKKITIILSIAIITMISAVFTGCKTTKEIPEGLTKAQLIQRGQDAFSSGDYKTAEAYYKNVIQNYGDDTESYIEVKYELGHLYLKTKDYDKAQEAFEEILELYSYASAGDLPASYKKLAEIGMSKIPENKKSKNEASHSEEE